MDLLDQPQKVRYNKVLLYV